MAIDQPLTSYKKDRKNMKNGGHTAAEARRITEAWEAKYGKIGNKTEKISLSEFLNREKNK
ncbi:MAG: hypothetical protein SO442_04040 [Prevotella sp.]|nr:hypothetical protein [Prevotella sp.]